VIINLVLGLAGLALIVAMWRVSGRGQPGQSLGPSEPVDLPRLLAHDLGQDFEVVQLAVKKDRVLLGGRRHMIDHRTVIEFTISSDRHFTHRETETMVQGILVHQPGLDCPYVRLSDATFHGPEALRSAHQALGAGASLNGSEKDFRALVEVMTRPPVMQFEVRGSWLAAHRYVGQFEGERTLTTSIESCLKVAGILARVRGAAVAARPARDSRGVTGRLTGRPAPSTERSPTPVLRGRRP